MLLQFLSSSQARTLQSSSGLRWLCDDLKQILNCSSLVSSFRGIVPVASLSNQPILRTEKPLPLLILTGQQHLLDLSALPQLLHKEPLHSAAAEEGFHDDAPAPHLLYAWPAVELQKYLLLELVSRVVHSSPTSPDHSSAVTVRFITCSVSEGRTKPDTLWRNSYSQVLVHCWSQCGSSAWGREISAAGCQQSVAHGALLFCRLLVCSAALDTIQQIGCVSVCVWGAGSIYHGT